MTRAWQRAGWVTLALGLLAVGVVAGHGWARRDGGHPAATVASSSPAAAEREVLYWYDPMVPDQHFDQPGKSPFMDMALVPKYADEDGGAGVRIDPGLQQSVGIRTETVAVGVLASSVRVPGTLTWDLRREAVVAAVVEGVVSRVHVKAPYTTVRSGQPLAAVLAPAWSSALAEAQALDALDSPSAEALRAAAHARLRVLGVPGTLSRDGSVLLPAPQAGTVTQVLVREGQAVVPGTPLFRLNGTETIWLEAAVPQAAVSRLRPGTPVEAFVSSRPGETFVGEVETMLPQVDGVSRTQTARIVLRNPDAVLVPGMYAEVALEPDAGEAVPLIPTQALIATGSESRVIVQDSEGRFRPVLVQPGRRSGERVEILSGLEGGERVVVSGQFLLDSEASLSGLLTRLTANPAVEPEAEAALHEAEATIEALTHDSVTLRHGPFRSLDMPGMTMAFPLAGPSVAEGVNIGDRVRVFVRADAQGLTVERLELREDRP